MTIKLTYKVYEIMDTDYIKMDYRSKTRDVITKLLFSKRDEVVLTDENSNDDVVAIFTRSDICKLKDLKQSEMDLPVYNYSSKSLVYVNYNEDVRIAIDIMMEKKIGRLLVEKDNIVIGLITNNNIRDGFYTKLEAYDITEEAFDNIYEAICICDSEGEVIYWNKSSEKLYNIKKEDIIGTIIDDSFPNALTNKVFKEKKPIKNIIHQPVAGKSVVVSAVPIFNAKNKMTAVITTDRDITEAVNLSERLKKEKEKSKFYESQYKEHIAKQYSFSGIISKNKKIIEAITLSQRVASSKANIMITGESGTGKDVFARAIHDASGRSGRFIAVNCSAIPDELLESELFGYESGAFTGASKGGKIGKFELADKGTLFLDEIGDMPMKMQSKLLRVLQDGIITKLGSEKNIETDVRIIAATNKNLREAIENEEFRRDLFYRLAVVHIELPPLRERREDIRELTKFFIKEFSEKEKLEIKSIDENIFSIFEAYSWEGNIRELRNLIQRIVILSDGGILKKEDIPSYITKDYNEKKLNEINNFEYGNQDFNETIKNLEIKMITDAMNKAGGNKSDAAKLLNINRSTLYYRLGLYNLEHLEKNNLKNS